MTTSCTISQLPASGSNRRRQTAVLVGHGERGGARTNALLLSLSDTASNPDIEVFGGVLNGSPSFEDAIHAARAVSDAPVLVYPFFMSPGYFVNTVLPRRIKDIGLTDDCRILQPFGSDPSLIDVMHRHAVKSATEAHLTPAKSRLLLVGHGSRSGAPASAISTRQAASALAQRNAFHCVDIAFLEEPPFVADVLPFCGFPTVTMGYFSGDGLHAAEDVPEAIADWGGGGIYTGPVGAAPGVADIIRAAVSADQNAQTASQHP